VVLVLHFHFGWHQLYGLEKYHALLFLALLNQYIKSINRTSFALSPALSRPSARFGRL